MDGERRETSSLLGVNLVYWFDELPDGVILKNDSRIQDGAIKNLPVPLFREEVSTAFGSNLNGEVILAIPLPLTVFGIILSSLILIAAIFIGTASYSRIEVVDGWIVPEAGLLRVQTKTSGTVDAVKVTDGNNIEKGTPIAVIKASRLVNDNDVGQTLWRNTGVEIDANQEQLRLSLQKFDSERIRLTGELERTESGIEIALKHERVTATRIDILQARADRANQLALKGAMTASDQEQAKLDLFTAQQDLYETQGTVLQLRDQAANLRSNLTSLSFDRSGSEAKARAIDAELRQKQLETGSLNSYELSSPISGEVIAVPVMTGQDVSAGAVIAIIIPAGSELEAELFVPSRAAGFISKGQEVRLRYQAFPYQKFGTARATVRSVSHTILAPNEIVTPGLTLKEPVLKVRVSLSSRKIRAYDEDIDIRPGMLLSADIVIERRTLFKWLLDPLYAVGRLQ